MQKRNWMLLFMLVIAMTVLFVASESRTQFCEIDCPNEPPPTNEPPTPTFDPNAPLIENFQAVTDQVTTQAGACLVNRVVDLRGRTDEIITEEESDCITSLEQLTLDGQAVTGLFISPNAQITVEGSTLYCWPSTTTGKMTCVRKP